MMEGDRGPTAGQFEGDGPPDAPRTSGDQRYLPVKLHL
jgi:hypothetical protein